MIAEHIADIERALRDCGCTLMQVGAMRVDDDVHINVHAIRPANEGGKTSDLTTAPH